MWRRQAQVRAVDEPENRPAIEIADELEGRDYLELVSRDKLCTLIDPDCFRESDLPPIFFEYFHNRAAEVEPRFDRRRKAREGVNDRKHPQLAPGGKLIMNEVHRPGLVRSWGHLAILAQP